MDERESIRLAKASFDRCSTVPGFLSGFYPRLFAACPEAEPLFAHTDLAKQTRLLRDAIGLLLIAPFGLFQLPGTVPPAKTILAIVALGSLGSALAYVLYFALIARAGASRAILVTYLVPAFALVYGAVFLGEDVTATALGGLVLVLGGTTLATGAARLRAARRSPA